MPTFLQRYATPFTTGLFAVSLISGVALFFHLGSQYFHGMHEWLSMVLIVPFLLHVWKNWRPMSLYFKQGTFIVAMLASLAGALFFAFGEGGEGRGGSGGPPPFAVFHAVAAKPLAQVAPLLDQTPEALTQALAARGFTVTGPDQTLADIAKASGKDDFELAAALVGR